jgi:hypothetical protein
MHRRPRAGILRVPAKLLEAMRAIRAAEQVHAPVALEILDAGEHRPGFVDALGHGRSIVGLITLTFP